MTPAVASPSAASTPACAPHRARRWRRVGVLTALALGAICISSGVDRRSAGPAAGVGLDGQVRATVPRGRLRVATFNIHSGRDVHGHRDLNKTAHSIEGLDLVALHEVRGAFAWQSPEQPAWLGERLGLAWLFAPSERRWWDDYWGNALLSAVPVGEWQRVPLVGTRGKAYRNYLQAEVLLPDATLHVLITHIDPQADRDHQLSAVISRFLALPLPALLLGDLNARADHPQMAQLLARPDVVDCVRVPTNADPTLGARIDWILARGLRSLSAGKRDHGASDHPCRWAVVEVDPALRSPQPPALPSESPRRQPTELATPARPGNGQRRR